MDAAERSRSDRNVASIAGGGGGAPIRRAWTKASAARASCNGARAAICSVSSAVNSSVGVKISVRETISDNQKQSEALRGTQWRSVALRGIQWQRTKPTCEQLCRQFRIRLDMLRRPLAEFRQSPIGEPSHHRRLGIICTQGAGGLASEHLWGRARRRGEHLHAVRKAPVASPRSTCHQ